MHRHVCRLVKVGRPLATHALGPEGLQDGATGGGGRIDPHHLMERHVGRPQLPLAVDTQAMRDGEDACAEGAHQRTRVRVCQDGGAADGVWRREGVLGAMEHIERAKLWVEGERHGLPDANAAEGIEIERVGAP